MPEVKLYIYDLSKGWMKTLKKWFCSELPAGIWHVSIVVYDTEITYNCDNGIVLYDLIEPMDNLDEKPSDEIYSGVTEKSTDDIINFIETCQEFFSPERYELLENNCITFVNLLSNFLLNRSLPDYIVSLPDLMKRLADTSKIIKFFLEYYRLSHRGSRSITYASHSPASGTRGILDSDVVVAQAGFVVPIARTQSGRVYRNQLRAKMEDRFRKRMSTSEMAQMYRNRFC